MSGIATRDNEILSRLGFNEFGDRSKFPVDLAQETGQADVNQQFPDKSIPLSKLDLVIYDAVVDRSGRGDFLTIQEAIDSGKRNIFIRNGTYVVNSNIVIPSNTALVGESTVGVIIDFNAGNNVLTVAGTLASNSGTVTITNGSAAIVGVGTSFTSVAAGDYLVIDQQWYEIDSITNDTSLDITETYNGVTRSGLSIFLAKNVKSNVFISNISLKNSTTVYPIKGIIDIRYSRNVSVENVRVTMNSASYTFTYGILSLYSYNTNITGAVLIDCNSGIYFAGSNNSRMLRCTARNSVSQGFTINSSEASLIDCYATGCYQYGFSVSGFASSLVGCKALGCGVGIWVNAADSCIIANNSIVYSANNGIMLAGTADRCAVTSNSVRDCGDWGIEIASSSCDKNNINNNTVYGNASGEINDSGTGTVLSNNITT